MRVRIPIFEFFKHRSLIIFPCVYLGAWAIIHTDYWSLMLGSPPNIIIIKKSPYHLCLCFDASFAAVDPPVLPSFEPSSSSWFRDTRKDTSSFKVRIMNENENQSRSSWRFIKAVIILVSHSSIREKIMLRSRSYLWASNESKLIRTFKSPYLKIRKVSFYNLTSKASYLLFQF